MNFKKRIIIIRSNAVNPDPKVEKEAEYLADDFDVIVLGWDRIGCCLKNEKKKNFLIHRLYVKSKYGVGIKNTLSMFKWWVYEFFWLMTHNFDFIHACDFDTYLPALVAAKVKRKSIIYDIFDFYTDMGSSMPFLLRKFIKRVDLFLIKFADGVIIADWKRLEQIKGSKPKKIISIYNTPSDFYEIYKKNIDNVRKQKIFIIGYIGLIEKERGFDSIINVVTQMDTVELIIGGAGPYEKEIKERIKKDNILNVKIIGRVSPYERALEVMSNFDITFALYNPEVANYRYSSPNKLFEAMMFEQPIIVSKDTSMDETVKKYKCGIAVDYNNEVEILKTISELIKLKIKGENPYGINGRNAYLTSFSSKNMQRELINFYKN
ncbi:MAG: glycosyltransferase family 4 protein [bacterium]